MESHLVLLNVLWDHEPADDAAAARSGRIGLRTRKAGGTPARRWFMESLLLLVHVLWDHEPIGLPLTLPSPRPTGRGWPAGG